MITQDKRYILKNKRVYIKNSLKFRKRIKQNLLRIKSSGRPYKNYKFLMSNAYLYISITIRPNNVFYTVKRVEQNLSRGLFPKAFTILSKTAGNYSIKISKKGLKSKTLPVILKFLKDLKLMKFKSSEFLVLNIVSPIKIRKKLIQFLSKSLIRSVFLKRKVILNIKSKKVFNGCTPCKQRRKKRKGFRILK